MSEKQTPLEMLRYVLDRLEEGQSRLDFYDDWEDYIDDVVQEIKKYITGEDDD